MQDISYSDLQINSFQINLFSFIESRISVQSVVEIRSVEKAFGNMSVFPGVACKLLNFLKSYLLINYS